MNMKHLFSTNYFKCMHAFKEKQKIRFLRIAKLIKNK